MSELRLKTKQPLQDIKRIPLPWVKHLPDEQKEDFKKTVLYSTSVLGRLKEILTDRMRELQAQEQKDDIYDSPSWGPKQAHLNGRKQELKETLSLLSFL